MNVDCASVLFIFSGNESVDRRKELNVIEALMKTSIRGQTTIAVMVITTKQTNSDKELVHEPLSNTGNRDEEVMNDNGTKQKAPPSRRSVTPCVHRLPSPEQRASAARMAP
jgi:hypothetical protein